MSIDLRQHVIAVDLGGTNIRAALCDQEGRILKRHKQLTLAEEGPEAVINRIVDSIQHVMPEAGTAAVKAVAAACPGPLDPFIGVVMYAPNLPGWIDIPLRDILRQRLGLPVAIGNDANLAALGEQRYGAGRGMKDLVYVTISTGIGGGVILNNQLVLGMRGLAAEIGHTTLDIHADWTHAGVPGSFEGYASGTGIARLAHHKLRAQLHAQQERGAPLSRMVELAGGDIDAVTAKEVGEAARCNDPLALEIIAEVARIIGLGFVNLLHLYDPAIIVVGGSVSLMGDLLFEPVRRTVQQYAMLPYRDRPIVPAALGDDCGLLGAAALAFDLA
ncbi:MAG: ROK family protein [Anaerolineae bacterium]|nr:ROK family protein [Thermoflexales bacterium]MDW8406162.1 ROK family protein [Anaerolineae bacterium]